MPKEEIEFVKEWLKQDKREDFLINKMKSDFEKASPEEFSQDLDTFIANEACYEDLPKAVPDLRLLLDKLKDIDNEMKKIALLNEIPLKQLVRYINKKGQISEEILIFLSQQYKYVEKIVKTLDSDLDKAKFLLYGGDIDFLPYIKDLYYRNQITKAKLEHSFSTEDLLAEIATYNEHLKRLSEIKDEREKAEYISSVDNNEMKEALFYNTIEKRENRDIVIKSFERKVDPEIKSLDELARIMITDFLEDRLGEDYTEKKRERVSIVFNKTDVYYGELDQNDNGRANHLFKRIILSDKHKYSVNRNIGFLIHEYAHMFSLFDFSYTADNPEDSIEEGMADTFVDLVVNHYINKHKDIILDGKKVRIDKPYSAYSGYDFENAWTRTMLAGLEHDGEDIKAIGEYLLGSKNKFAIMIFGEKDANSKEQTKFGITIIVTDRSELYHSPKLDFSSIDEGSIYYRRNHILPLYQIQNRIGEKEDLVGILSTGIGYYANYIADQYFYGRSFYEIPEDEFARFIRLLEAQVTPNNQQSAIINIDEYKNDLINNLTEEQIKQFSFQILERIPAIFGKSIDAGTNLERVMKLAFDEEIRKISEGQPIETTEEKMVKINQKYKGVFASKTESNMYINDYINDYFFAVSQAEQRQKEQKNKKIQITTEEIRDATMYASITAKKEAIRVENSEFRQDQEKGGEEPGDDN